MKLEWELIASEIVPSLRAMIARELIVSYNLNQSEAARLMGISQPAVSQYIRRIRGKNDRIFANGEIAAEVRKFASVVFENKTSSEELSAEFMNLCRLAAMMSAKKENPQRV